MDKIIKKLLFIIPIFLLISFCLDAVRSDKSQKISLCFWNSKAISLSGLARMKKLEEATKPLEDCTVISFLDQRETYTSLKGEFENLLSTPGKSFQCLESEPKEKEEGIRKERYILCAREDIVVLEGKIDYEDSENYFARPPAIFFLQGIGKKIAVIPFQATPKDVSELIDFQKVIDFVYKSYSDRRAFFGGNFYALPPYQAKGFIESLSYSIILKDLIANIDEKEVSIFTDPESAKNCSGSERAPKGSLVEVSVRIGRAECDFKLKVPR